MARPSKLTPELQAAVVANIKDGYPYAAAARKAGISSTTFNRWRAEGAEEEPGNPKRDFRDATTRARDEYAASLLEIVERAAPKDWKAAAWILERRYSDAYGRHTKIEHEGSMTAPVVVLPVEEVASDGTETERNAVD